MCVCFVIFFLKSVNLGGKSKILTQIFQFQLQEGALLLLRDKFSSNCNELN